MTDTPNPPSSAALTAEPLTMSAEVEGHDRDAAIDVRVDGRVLASALRRIFKELDAARAALSAARQRVQELEAGHVTSDDGTAFNWRDELAAVQAELARVRADAQLSSVSRLSEAERDSERLDWFEARLPNVIVMGGYRVSIFDKDKSDLIANAPIGAGPTFRAALDAAKEGE